MMAPGGPRATVVSVDGGLYRLPSCPPKREARRRRALSNQAPPSANRSSPHGPGRPRGVAARRRVDSGRQRANGAVRDRRLERPGDSPPARRRHRQGRETASRTPSSNDARFHRVGEGDCLRRVGRHGRLGGFGRRGIRRGESAWQAGAPQPWPAGRIHPRAYKLSRSSGLVEP